MLVDNIIVTFGTNHLQINIESKYDLKHKLKVSGIKITCLFGINKDKIL